MMNRCKQLIFIILIFFIASCASVTKDIKVNAEADPKVNLKKYKTYSWLGSASVIHDPEGKWEPPQFDADSEVKFLIDRELRKRGIMEVTTDPDIMVGFTAGINMAALGVKENPETKMVTLENIPRAGLALVFVDASTGYLIWIAAAVGEIQQEPSIDTARKRLDYAVSQMFKLLPR